MAPIRRSLSENVPFGARWGKAMTRTTLGLALAVGGPLLACGDEQAAPPAGLVKISAEPKGVHCRAGGKRIEAGPDKNRDGVLDSAEVQKTDYLCEPATADPVLLQRTVWAQSVDPIALNHHSDDLVATAPVPTNRLSLTRVGTSAYNAFDFGRSAAEIVDFNPLTKQVFTHNTRLATVTYHTLSATGALTDRGVIDPKVDLADVPKDGRFVIGINSCAVADNILAIAVEVFDFGERIYVDGRIAIYDVAGPKPVFVTAVKVGPQPDSVIFTHDHTKMLVAGEGETTMLDRNMGETIGKDPEGSISIINRPAGGWKAVTNADVTTLGFQDFNDGGPRASERPPGLHRIGPEGVTWSQMFEPEYIATPPDDSVAWVVLQEMNAAAIVDLKAKPPAITEIRTFGLKDGLKAGNEFDASELDGRVRLANWPVYMMYQPDTIKSFVGADGKVYYATANEGDPRNEDWGWYENEKISALNLDPIAFPGKELWQKDEMLGRLQVTKTLGDADGDGLYENLYAFGGRSFAIWDEDGQLVFDSGSDFERITAKLYGVYFDSLIKEFLPQGNAQWKGPEPEALSIGTLNVPVPGSPGKTEPHTYVFIGAEKMSGWWVYDVTYPARSEFVTYFSNRHPEMDPTLDVDADLSPEGSVFVSAQDSPTGKPLLIAGNEVSSTTSVYEIKINP
jgi:2',3'-cyclic-nucleotide 2'-phosphodiesterase / 3'-nucleotidase / 5'-nucleotidase